jgi:DNA-binding transcriptional regulator YdaS (Cro superfamily)
MQNDANDQDRRFEALTSALQRAGSQAKFARICGCTEPNVWQLIRAQRPLPARYVLNVEAATGVSRHELRPDIYPVT